MPNVEILAHITAPSTYKDDKRYAALAKAVATFEPATVTRVFGVGDLVEIAQQAVSTRTDTTFDTSLSGWSGLVQETPVPQHVNHLLSTVGGLPTSGPPDSEVAPRTWSIGKPVRPEPKKRCSLGANPPYKNPLLNRQWPQADVQAARTPEQRRPRTAPSHDSSHTKSSLSGWITRKRARSESSSFESLGSVVHETPHVQHAHPLTHSSGSITPYFSSSDPSRAAPQVQMKHFSSSQGDQPASKRQRIADTGTADLENEKEDQLPPVNAEHHTQPYFLRDRSLDWTSSASSGESGHSDSTTTPTATATPSNRLPVTTTPDKSLAADSTRLPPAFQNPSSPINLLCQDLRSTPTSPRPQQQTRRKLGPADFTASQLLKSSPPIPYPSVSSLPTSITPATPPTGHGPFVTHITPFLAKMVTSLLPDGLAKHFRPVYVARDIRVLERGAWHLPITIARKEVVDGARRETSSEAKLDRMKKRGEDNAWNANKESSVEQTLAEFKTHQENRDREWQARSARRQAGLSSSPVPYLDEGKDQGLNADPEGKERRFVERRRQDYWTEVEVIEFWRKCTKSIGELGRAGWGVSVYREGEEENVLIKIFCWGEVLGHVWILLWVLSEKLVSYVPMEWGDGDGEVVVRMSGYRRKHGVLGPWIEKGLVGEGKGNEKGVWGIGKKGEAKE